MSPWQVKSGSLTTKSQFFTKTKPISLAVALLVRRVAGLLCASTSCRGCRGLRGLARLVGGLQVKHVFAAVGVLVRVPVRPPGAEWTPHTTQNEPDCEWLGQAAQAPDSLNVVNG